MPSLPPARRIDRSQRALAAAAVCWLSLALLGQWAFFYYIAAFYGPSALSGDFESWNRLAALGRTPFVAGDVLGNLAFLAHALGAGIVALGGALQLVPQIRVRAPRFHRWNGRVFLVTVVVLSLSGFYLVWVRGTSPSTFDALSTSCNGVLILGFAALAYRSARARDFLRHRRWALRLYLVSNAQWFLRVGVFGYFMLNRMLGLKASFGDPFIAFWTFGCYAVPLAVLELYLRARDGRRAGFRVAVAIALLALSAVMLLGMTGFALFSQRLIAGGPIALPR
jgi:hypothetical protein